MHEIDEDYKLKACQGLCTVLDDIGMCMGMCSTDHSHVQKIYDRNKSAALAKGDTWILFPAFEPKPVIKLEMTVEQPEPNEVKYTYGIGP
jgi:hypothetical protein